MPWASVFSAVWNEAVVPLIEQDRLALRSERYPYKLLLQIAPLHLWRPLIFEVKVARARVQGRVSRRALRGATDLWLNVGCGYSGLPGWVNIDIFDGPGVSHIYDCRKSLPVEPNSTRAIYTEHFFEHLDRLEEAPPFLEACAAALQPGGVLRIAVPDAEKYLRAYSSDGWGSMTAISPYIGDEHVSTKLTKMDIVNMHFRQDYQHKWVYDFESLERLLQSVGFKQVVRQEYNESALDKLCIDSSLRRVESLYVEATI